MTFNKITKIPSRSSKTILPNTLLVLSLTSFGHSQNRFFFSSFIEKKKKISFLKPEIISNIFFINKQLPKKDFTY